MIEKAVNNQDHQKGKDTRSQSCSVKSPFDYDAEKCCK